MLFYRPDLEAYIFAADGAGGRSQRSMVATPMLYDGRKKFDVPLYFSVVH